MNLKRLSVLLAGFMFSVVIATPVFAQYGQGYEDSIFQRVFDILVGVFSLDFLDNDASKLHGFLRGIVWVGIFTVIYNLLKRVGKGMFTGSSSVVLAAVFATLSVIAIPNGMLELLAGGYSAIMAGILISVIAIFVIVVLYQVLPGLGIKGRLLLGVRIAAIVLLLFFLERASSFISGNFYVLIPLVPGLLPGPKPSGRSRRSGVRL